MRYSRSQRISSQRHPSDQLTAAVRTIAGGDALLAPAITRRLIAEYIAVAAPTTPPELDELSRRELEILRLVATGMSNAEIANTLVIGETTVKTHVTRVRMKLRVRDRVQAVVLAYETGVTGPRLARNPTPGAHPRSYIRTMAPSRDRARTSSTRSMTRDRAVPRQSSMTAIDLGSSCCPQPVALRQPPTNAAARSAVTQSGSPPTVVMVRPSPAPVIAQVSLRPRRKSRIARISGRAAVSMTRKATEATTETCSPR